MARVEALSFDCYGTLIDWESGISAALEPWARASGLHHLGDQLIETFARFETVLQQENPAWLYQQVLYETLRKMCQHYEVPFSAAAGADFGASVGRWPAFADSAEALRRLKEKFKLIILSNIDRGSFFLSNARLGVEFDLIITAQEVGAYKPDQRGFLLLFERLGDLGVPREGLLHVAQSLYHDHEPAAALELPSVWIDRRHDRAGFGATPAPQSGAFEQPRRFPSMQEFADTILEEGGNIRP